MRVLKISLDRPKKFKTQMVACIGYFDGLHKGHQELLRQTVEMAKRKHCETAMITFEPDPWVVIKGAQNVKHISTMRQRINLAVELGMNNIVLLDFSREMSELTPDDFMNKVLGSLNLKGLVCGFDFHFGFHGAGTAEYLQNKALYEVKIVTPVEDEIGKISSTRISECIQKGNMEQATEMLGYHFNIVGRVIHGMHRGTSMGFPTANVDINEEYLLPRSGVYAGYATINGKRYEAMINIGRNPTFRDVDHVSLEAHLLDCHEDMYGKLMKVDFVKFVRGERKFLSKENLIMQLEQDMRTIRSVLDETK